MPKMKVEETIEKKVVQLRETEKQKREELAQIARDLKRYETALESLKGNLPETPRKRRTKH
jgi:flagellar motor switch protein FliM